MYLSGCVFFFCDREPDRTEIFFGKGDGKQQQFLVIIKISTCEGSLAKNQRREYRREMSSLNLLVICTEILPFGSFGARISPISKANFGLNNKAELSCIRQGKWLFFLEHCTLVIFQTAKKLQQNTFPFTSYVTFSD